MHPGPPGLSATVMNAGRKTCTTSYWPPARERIPFSAAGRKRRAESFNIIGPPVVIRYRRFSMRKTADTKTCTTRSAKADQRRVGTPAPPNSHSHRPAGAAINAFRRPAVARQRSNRLTALQQQQAQGSNARQAQRRRFRNRYIRKREIAGLGKALAILESYRRDVGGIRGERVAGR